MNNTKPAIFRGKYLPGYHVSDEGIVYKDYKIRFGQKLSVYPYIPLKGHKSEKETKVKLTFPTDLYEYEYSSRHNNGNSQLNIPVHKLVMAAFRPIDEFPPDSLIDVWKDIPEKAKEWIRESVYVNHINHNPHDNRLENLEYVTPRENTHKALEFYSKNDKVSKNIVNINHSPIKITSFCNDD